MVNLSLLEETPRWRAAAVAKFAKLLGIRIHIEGIPFGSCRAISPMATDDCEQGVGA